MDALVMRGYTTMHRIRSPRTREQPQQRALCCRMSLMETSSRVDRRARLGADSASQSPAISR